VCADSISLLSIAQVASGGAAPSQIFRWLKQDLSDEANEARIQHERRPRALSDDEEALLVGFATSRRSLPEPVSLAILSQFCESYLSAKPSLATLSNIMSRNGFSSQKALKRNSRMTSDDVVGDAIDALEEIRSFNFPPHHILCMDETDLWSNVTAPKTYHFRNWCVIMAFPASGRSMSYPHCRAFPLSHPPRDCIFPNPNICLGRMQLCMKLATPFATPWC
jgi:hypothetical protein